MIFQIALPGLAMLAMVSGASAASNPPPPAAIPALSSYIASVTADPKFASVAGVLATAIPSSLLSSALADPTSFLAHAGSPSKTEAWLRALPSDVNSYLSSVASVESSIISKATSPHGQNHVGTASTTASHSKGAAAAARPTYGPAGLVAAGAAVFAALI